MRTAITIALFFLIVELVTVQATPTFPPSWMKVSAFAEYKTESSTLVLVNNVIQHQANSSLTYRWECTELNETMAKLKISLYSNERPENLTLSSIVLIDTITRDTYLLNGTPIGTTRLWMPADPSEGQEMVLWNLPPDRIVGTARTIGRKGAGFSQTVQGHQRIFFIGGNGTMSGQKTIMMSIICDFSTGILLDGPVKYDSTFQALGIKEIMSPLKLVNTNIDLGPRELSFDMRAWIPVAAIVAAFAITAGTVYVRRRRKKR